MDSDLDDALREEIIEALRGKLKPMEAQLVERFDVYDNLLDINRNSVLESDKMKMEEARMDVLAVAREMRPLLKMIFENEK